MALARGPRNFLPTWFNSSLSKFRPKNSVRHSAFCLETLTLRWQGGSGGCVEICAVHHHLAHLGSSG